MKRDYSTGVSDNIEFFVGVEVEMTPAFNMPTLFVTGIQDVDKIMKLARENKCAHIFFGANHSFDIKSNLPNKSSFDIINEWDLMITALLDYKFLVTLDFDVSYINHVLEMSCQSHEKFIPQVSVKLPYVKLLNYNAMLKIDDIGFNESNPGVWCHVVHDLLDRSKFTPWDDYGNDTPT